MRWALKKNLNLFHCYETSARPNTKSHKVRDESLIESLWSFVFHHACEGMNHSSIGVWATHKSSLYYISWTSDYGCYEASHKSSSEMHQCTILHSGVLLKHLLELIIACHLTNVNADISNDIRLNSSVESESSFISKDGLIDGN